MEAARSCETSTNMYQTTVHHVPEDSNLHSHRRHRREMLNPHAKTASVISTPIHEVRASAQLHSEACSDAEIHIQTPQINAATILACK
jgi:hypothetical protein